MIYTMHTVDLNGLATRAFLSDNTADITENNINLIKKIELFF